MDNEVIQLITAYGPLGALVVWYLWKVQPQQRADSAELQKTFKDALIDIQRTFKDEMEKNRQAQDRYNERLIQWLGTRADLPNPPPHPRQEHS